MSSPIIREYRASDRGDVVALVKRTLLEFGFSGDLASSARRPERSEDRPSGQSREATFGENSIEADLDAIDVRYRAPRGGFFVAELDGHFAGSVAVRPKDGTTCELKRLYVDAAARGHGLGQRLYEHAEAFARQAGYSTIWLDSSRRFVQARKLYQRNGFALLQELDNDWEDNVYEKRLLAPA